MRALRTLVSLIPLIVLSGCGYVHFGRLPAPNGDAALQQAYVDLGIQQKILKQELQLARKENDALRQALDRTAGSAGTASADLARQLESTTRELATLRVSYAKLQAERTRAASAAENTSQLAETQQKLANSLRDYAQVQAENAQLRHNLDASRAENASLAEQLKSAVAETRQSQATMAQLNGDLLAQKAAREEAERAAAALRAQLDAVVARANRADAANGTAEPAAATTMRSSPDALAALQSAKAPPSRATELHISLTHFRNAADTQAQSVASISTSTPTASTSSSTASVAPPNAEPTTAAPVAAASAATPQTYTVQAGDTLEKIAQHVYGSADQWVKLYAANSDLLTASQGLRPGMQLHIPAP